MTHLYIYNVTNIDWDTDGEDVPGLPTDYVIRSSVEMNTDEILDALSDEFGYCIFGSSIYGLSDEYTA